MSDENIQTGRDLVPVSSEAAARDVERPIHKLRLPMAAIDDIPSMLIPLSCRVSNPGILQERSRLSGSALKQEVVITSNCDLVSMW